MRASVSEMRIKEACRALKMPGALKALDGLVRDAESRSTPYLDFLAALLEQELTSRQQSRLRTNLKRARFPLLKTLDQFDFSAQPSVSKQLVMELASGNFIAQRHNVLLIGNPGTGKSHIATGLGMAAVSGGHRVRFETALSLIDQLLAAADRHALVPYMKTWRRVDLLILDELGYIPLARDSAHALFAFLSDCYEKRSVIATSNLEFSRWTEIFQDPQLTTALLDRLTHHAHLIQFTGDSYRFRDSLRSSPQNSVPYAGLA